MEIWLAWNKESSAENGEEELGSETQGSGKKKRRKGRHIPGDKMDGELTGLVKALKETDMAQFCLGQDLLLLEEERCAAEK